MTKKILILLGSVWSLSGFSQTNTDLTDAYQPPQSVTNVTVRMLQGFHADSRNVIYSDGGEFIARSKNFDSNNPNPEITNPPVVYNPSSGENYIYTRSYLVPVTESNANAPQVQSITYFDGLGRSKQNIAVRSSPTGKDLVTPIVYDGFGRQTRDYLPIPQSVTKNSDIYLQNSSLVDFPVTNSAGFYPAGERIFSEKTLESSPLDRVLEQYGAGADWKNDSKRNQFGYEANGGSEVLKFVTTTSWAQDATQSTLSLATENYYSPATLYKNKVTDEDDNISYEFKNGQGQTLLVKKMLTATVSADTYYVYNEYDQLAFVISPQASDKVKAQPAGADLGETGEILKELSYQYRYDGRNRLAEKKLPGKGWEYMVYDRQDRLAMTQDANLGAGQHWLFTKYDQFGRVAYTGLYTSSQVYGSAGRSYEQGEVNKVINNTERKSSSGFTVPGLIVYYDNLAANNYPNTIDKLLSVNYYDTYPNDKPNLSTLGFTQTFITDNAQANGISTKGLPVASYLNNIEMNSWTKTFSYYDDKGRAIATYSKNHLGGHTQIESTLDFTGTPQKTITKQRRRSTDTDVIIQERFVYDHQNRLKQHYHQVNSSAEVLLADNTYDELGRLNKKKVGNNLQEISYAYNIRGWVTGINSGDIAATAPYTLNNGKLFGYRIKYINPDNPSLGAAKYNGNIAEVDWMDKDGPLKRYGYQYDGLNRLLRGNYQDPEDAVPETHINDEALTYDLNGNIKTLVRNSKHGKYYTPIVIDNLTYNYANGNGNSNRLQNITDASNNSSGYEGGGQAIAYDPNGNMTAIPYKGISAIAYNLLNLPSQIDQNANTLKYYYRADGTKLKKQFTLVNTAGTKIINTEYLDGFQYSTPNTDPLRRALEEQDKGTVSVATAGELEAFSPMERLIDNGGPDGTTVDNMVLSFFPTSEGYYDYENLRYIYQYKDHLGNVRVSYVKNPDNTISIMDRNNYYPFGMNFLKGSLLTVYDPMTIPYNYKYNGKELQETGMYDYGARFYMPDIGRWGVLDILAETSRKWSPYTYVYDNPLRFIDPTGMYGEDPKKPDPNKVYKGGDIQEVVLTKLTAVKGQMAGISSGMPSNCLMCYANSSFSMNLPPLPDSIPESINRPPLPNGAAYMMSGDTFGFTDLAGIAFNRWFEDLEPDEQKGAILIGGMAIILTHNTKIAGAEVNALLTESRVAGIAGEEAVGVIASKVRIPSLTGTAKYRIPDIITGTTIEEVKNVKSLSFTRQLKDFHLYSKENGLQMIIHTRSNTVLSGPLRNAVNSGQIIQKFIPGK